MINNLLAQTEHDIGEISGGSLGLGGTSPSTTTLAQIISSIIGLLTVISGIYFIFVLITGAIGIIASGGDKGAFEDARKRITTGAIGLVLVISAMFIVEVASTVFGLPDLLDLGTMVSRIRLP